MLNAPPPALLFGLSVQLPAVCNDFCYTYNDSCNKKKKKNEKKEVVTLKHQKEKLGETKKQHQSSPLLKQNIQKYAKFGVTNTIYHNYDFF